MNVEKAINYILSKNGYTLKYKETFPSSPEDMYELTVWVEDKNLNPYCYRTIFVRGAKDPKKIAFDKLANIFIESYYASLWEDNEN